ncbi:MAG: rhamnogalacturonan lyase, partial [Oscillospiraceae bacterium]|nr:rhamnogalacturonan lyase [Oscillospiraceae bacterium]
MTINRNKRRLTAILTVFALVLGLFGVRETPVVQTASAATTPIVEFLNRGITAVNTGNGMLVKWRCLASDPANTTYRLYRNDTLIYTSNPASGSTAAQPTNFVDRSGNAQSKYRVDAAVGTNVFHSEDKVLISNTNYFDIPMTPPTSTHHANDVTVGDVDGDGEYELFVKWFPDNAQDNANSGTTGNTFIDCYKLNGTRLWRIDLGPNIRSGSHYTQMLVADYEMNGKAKLIVKTADGTIDGKGARIGSTAIHRNSSGYILAGDEFLTLFDGQTGENLHTIPYPVPRGTVSQWGDNYGNRVDRHLGAVAYLDGVRPSAVVIRGYYTRMTATAYDVVDNKLVRKWLFDSGFNANDTNNPAARAHGQGNHNVMPAAAHAGDSRQSIFLGSAAIRYDGTLLWSNRLGHGDAIDVGKFIPSRSGLQQWYCLESGSTGMSLRDALTGAEIFSYMNSGDVGRSVAANVWTGSTGAQFWGAGTSDVFNTTGGVTGMSRPTNNFLIYWEGGLERQTFDGTGSSGSTGKIERINSAGRIERVNITPGVLATNGYITNNSTKNTPGLIADIFGDWREELIMRASDSRSLRIYTTFHESPHRIVTMMHDPQYRNQVAGQNICYNQPSHPSFYLGTGNALPPIPDVEVRNNGTVTPPTTTATTTTTTVATTTTTTTSATTTTTTASPTTTTSATTTSTASTTTASTTLSTTTSASTTASTVSGGTTDST